MPVTILKTLDSQEINYVGDLEIDCSIPSNTKICVKNGSLTINGDVGENAILKLQIPPLSTEDPMFGYKQFFGEYLDLFIPPPSPAINIKGNLNKGVRIFADAAVTCGNVGVECEVNARGKVTCLNIGSKSKITTENADIKTADVGVKAEIRALHGTITSANIAAAARLDGDNISARHVSRSAFFNTEGHLAVISAESEMFLRRACCSGIITVAGRVLPRAQPVITSAWGGIVVNQNNKKMRNTPA